MWNLEDAKELGHVLLNQGGALKTNQAKIRLSKDRWRSQVRQLWEIATAEPYSVEQAKTQYKEYAENWKNGAMVWMGTATILSYVLCIALKYISCMVREKFGCHKSNWYNPVIWTTSKFIVFLLRTTA